MTPRSFPVPEVDLDAPEMQRGFVRLLLSGKHGDKARSILKCGKSLFSGVWQLEAGMAAGGFGHLGLDRRPWHIRVAEVRLPAAEIAILVRA